MVIDRDAQLDNVRTVRKFGTLNSKQSGPVRQNPKPQDSEKEEVKRLEEPEVVDDSKKKVSSRYKSNTHRSSQRLWQQA